MNMRDFSKAPGVKRGPGVQTISPMPVDRTGEPGQGLEDVGHRVLTYRDLVALDRNPDVRAPSRSLEIHLTGNMERYMWSFDGEKYSEVKAPIPFLAGERVRVTLVNDTMMGHPIHLHGHFFELVTGKGVYAPRKHTVLVQPGGKRIVAWALEHDCDADAITSNLCEIEWPPRSGKALSIPEIYRAGWFDERTALVKILKGQAGFIREISQRLAGTS